MSSHAAVEPGSGPAGADGADGAADEAAEPAGSDPHGAGGAGAADAGAAGAWLCLRSEAAEPGSGPPEAELADVVVNEATELADESMMPTATVW